MVSGGTWNPARTNKVSDTTDATSYSLGVNNLFNKLGYTEAEGQNNLGSNPLYIARSINGRTVKASLKYQF